MVLTIWCKPFPMVVKGNKKHVVVITQNKMTKSPSRIFFYPYPFYYEQRLVVGNIDILQLLHVSTVQQLFNYPKSTKPNIQKSTFFLQTTTCKLQHAHRSEKRLHLLLFLMVNACLDANPFFIIVIFFGFSVDSSTWSNM